MNKNILIILSFLLTSSASWGMDDDNKNGRAVQKMKKVNIRGGEDSNGQLQPIGIHKKNDILWQPSAQEIQQAKLTYFMEKISQRSGVSLQTYADLHSFSIDQPEEFWKTVWAFCGVIAETQGARALIGAEKMESAEFFPDARLNYAENLLRRRDDAVAVTFYGEDKVYRKLTFRELYQETAKLTDVFRKGGVKPGDRIAGYLPNMPETLIAMLATTSIGAVWSSCSADFGIPAVVDRFSQIAPKVLLMADGYYHGGKTYNCLENLPDLRSQIPSIEQVIVVPYVQAHHIVGPFEIWDKLLADSKATSIKFEQLPFNHPLFILYSSGTTGIPKCIVHGAGGTLLQHLKEHQLHCDIKPGDQVFYYTTCGWMMWNWLASALASEASLVLYDGFPQYPHPEILFEIAAKESMTLFGTSAKYIDNLAKSGAKPINKYSLPSLRMMTSTGSPLAPESFDYVYSSIKQDVCLSSISGGTDIISCFALGNPISPVWRGELQCRGLGLAVDVFDEEGKSMAGGKGELVCTKPFPSQPLGFWNDPTGEKYHAAYFSRFPNVWHHGDFVEMTTHNGIIIHGRSDAVLNPGGVRVGTAEIYRQVDRIPQVDDCVVVGQKWEKDERIILFVKLKNDSALPLGFLPSGLKEKINEQIRSNTSRHHVPKMIIAVPDIPRTKNGKLAERAVRDTIHGELVKNKDALANPEALDHFRNLPDLAMGYQKKKTGSKL